AGPDCSAQVPGQIDPGFTQNERWNQRGDSHCESMAVIKAPSPVWRHLRNPHGGIVKSGNKILRLALVLFIFLGMSAFGQITPSADSYTNTVDPTTNYGA